MSDSDFFILLLHCVLSTQILSTTTPNYQTNDTSTSKWANITEKSQLRAHVCTLRIIVDHTLVYHSLYHTLDRLIDHIHKIVQTTSDIFGKIDFTGDGRDQDLTLYIHDFVIYHDIYNSPFHKEDLSAFRFLEKFTRLSSHDVCLAVAFTFRDFENNVIGLGYQFPVPGGACHESCNKIVISLQSGGLPLTFNQSVFALAHEVTHAFGAVKVWPGDQKKCKFAVKDVFYVKKIRKGEGLDLIRFSNCTLKDMGLAIRSDLTFCLTYEYPVCGNGNVDEVPVVFCGDDGLECGFGSW